jgi:hypothetical protein
MTDSRWRSDLQVQTDSTVHVWPVEDMKEHILVGVNCWCEPRVEETDYGAKLVIHNKVQ